MPKNNRELKYPKRLQILVSDEQYNFVKNELNGGIGYHVRDMIETHHRFYNKEITNLEKEFKEIESHYIAMKKRLEDLKIKQQILDDQQNARNSLVEGAKLKLLKVYEGYHNRSDLIPSTILKTYSDLTGLSIVDLKFWLDQQHK